MKSISIKIRLILTLGFLSLLLIAVGTIGLNGMNNAIHGLETVYLDRLIPTAQLSRINDLMRTNIQQLQLGAQHDPRLDESALHEATHTVARHSGAVDKGIAEITDIWKEYMATFLTPEETQLADEFATARKYYVEQLKLAQKLLSKKSFQEGNIHAFKVLVPAFNRAKERAEKLLQLQVDVAEAEYNGAEEEYAFARNLSIASIAVGLLLALVAGYFLIRAITQPLNRAVSLAEAIADGDLTQSIEVTSDDETGQLLYALRDMNDKLRNIVDSVVSSAEEVSTGSSEISRGNVDLSQRTEEQASSLEETAASMEEMTATVRQNADNTNQANQLAVSARDQAEKGGEVVSRATSAMSDITESSKRISDIIGVIDEIAFQTNLLALNAAVEAARAGEQGRGFAVVAGEVRILAGRSAEAAKEIKGLIQDSVEKVELGSSLVNESGETLRDIVEGVKKVTDIIAEIAASSREQANGIDEVNKAITQMDEMTQQNAALVEEAASASEAMSHQAKNLNVQMAFFTIGDSSGLTRPSTAAKSVQKLAKNAKNAKKAKVMQTREPHQTDAKAEPPKLAPKPISTPKPKPKPKAPTAVQKRQTPAKSVVARSVPVDDDEWEEF